MKALGADGRRRAARLLRWYPRDWRERYGDEFLELLVDDLEERPHSIDRLLDVARSGLVVRLAAAGLGVDRSIRTITGVDRWQRLPAQSRCSSRSASPSGRS